MRTQRILQGDCLDVLSDQRDVKAFVFDPPGLVGYGTSGGFMGRKWDQAHQKFGTFVPMLPTRDKRHASELEQDYDFTLYWAIRFSMAYDIAAKDAVIVLWTLPRTSHLMANALRAAGWTIKENLIHLFGTGWMKANRTTEDGERVPNAFAPGYENWIVGVKGKPDLDIDACRVPRGAEHTERVINTGNGGAWNQTGASWNRDIKGNPLGSLPKNALLSHCEECVRVGQKRINGANHVGTKGALYIGDSVALGKQTPHAPSTFVDRDGTESVPAFHCLAGCVCGARSKWDPEKPLPRCPCGETWQWLCAVAEVNAQSGDRPGMTGGGKHRADYAGGLFGKIDCDSTLYGGTGGSARFFSTFSYLAKCSSSERHAGCENLFWRANKKNLFGYDQITREEWEAIGAEPTEGMRAAIGKDKFQKAAQRARGNTHATVKSIRQMLWFHAVTGADKIVDLTAGSCSGALAAHLADIEWIGAEVCPEAIVIGEARLAWWSALSAEAKRAMLEDDVVPTPAKTNELQRNLFE